MKSVLFLAFSLLLCSFKGYKKCESCARSDLKGKVKFLTERIITGDKNALDGKYEFEQHIYHYNKRGRLKWRSDSSYVYDKITKRGVSNVYVEFYIYKRRRLHKVMTGPGRSPLVRQFTYDRQGRRVLTEHYTLVAETKTIRTDRMVSTVYLDRVAHIANKVWEADTMKLISKEKEEYDDKGRRIKSMRYDERTNQYLTTNDYSYDGEGNIAVSGTYNTFNQALQYTINYKYNKDNSLTEELRQMSNGTTHTTKYTYSDFDTHGNYRTITSQTDQLPPVSARRIIHYY